jgi:hypothetical protein
MTSSVLRAACLSACGFFFFAHLARVLFLLNATWLAVRYFALPLYYIL